MWGIIGWGSWYLYMLYVGNHWVRVTRTGGRGDTILWHFPHATCSQPEPLPEFWEKKAPNQRRGSRPLNGSRSTQKGPGNVAWELSASAATCCWLSPLSCLEHLDLGALFSLVFRDFLFFLFFFFSFLFVCLFHKVFTTFVTYFIILSKFIFLYVSVVGKKST